MIKSEQLSKLIKLNNGVVTTKLCAEAGIARVYISNFVKQGVLKRVEKGIYIKADEEMIDEFYILQEKYRRCIYSHHCALYLHNLSERVPFRMEVTVPSSYHITLIGECVDMHYTKLDFYEIGIIEVRTQFDNIVQVYNMERTICDIIRDKKNMDIEIYVKALKMYMKSKQKDLRKLKEYAKIFRIEKRVNELLEVLSE